MIRKDFYLTNDQFRFLHKLEGNVSEHLRRAIDKYINDIRKLEVSQSPSKYDKPGNT
jgi:hypothetical protein